MKIVLIIFGIFAIAGFEHVMAQRNQVRAEAPTELLALNFRRSTDSVYLIWMGNRNVASYIIRIYRSSDNVLYKTLRDVTATNKNVTNLASGMSYYATVSAVYVNSAGLEFDSPESNRASFETDVACTNGQVFLSCSAHCIATCNNPQPVCSRDCRPGCGCPSVNRIWHENRCISENQCPGITAAGPIKPENVQVLADGDDIFLTWTPVEVAQSYTVKVRAAGTNEELREIQTVIPIVPITNLAFGVTYEFSVRIIPKAPQSTLRRQQLPPPPLVYQRHVTKNGFIATWVSQKKADTYTFVLYDQNQTNLLAVQKGIKGNSIVVDRLAPGSTYYIAVASASPTGKLGPFSNLRPVSTTGIAVNEANRYSSVVTYTPMRTTTALAPTTTTLRAPEVTRCRQYHESVRNFYNEFPGVNGPEYPECDSDGMFVTKKCNSAMPPRKCWCIDQINGDKVVGSEFGIGNSNFELSCDHFGSLNIESLKMKVRNLSSTSVEVQWNEVKSVRGYVLVVDNGIQKARTTSIEGSSATSYQIHNLRPGHDFRVGVYAVDSQGKSSPVTLMELTTPLLDKPQNVTVTKLTSTSIRLSWRYTPNADGASVKLISQETRKVMRSFKVSATSTIITDLKPGRYEIEVREIRCSLLCDNAKSSVLHSSEAVSVEMSLLCKMPLLDLIFAFDVSPGSGLQLQKQMAEDITRRVPAINHSTGTRIAALKYYQHATSVFNYESFDDANNIIDSIRNITSGNTSSNTANMLDFVRTRYFNSRSSETYRQRKNSVAAVLIFLGGSVRSATSLQQASSQLKERTNVIAIGTSTENQRALSQLASNSDMKYTVSSSENIPLTVTRLTEQLCVL